MVCYHPLFYISHLGSFLGNLQIFYYLVGLNLVARKTILDFYIFLVMNKLTSISGIEERSKEI